MKVISNNGESKSVQRVSIRTLSGMFNVEYKRVVSVILKKRETGESGYGRYIKYLDTGLYSHGVKEDINPFFVYQLSSEDGEYNKWGLKINKTSKTVTQRSSDIESFNHSCHGFGCKLTLNPGSVDKLQTITIKFTLTPYTSDSASSLGKNYVFYVTITRKKGGSWYYYIFDGGSMVYHSGTFDNNNEPYLYIYVGDCTYTSSADMSLCARIINENVGEDVFCPIIGDISPSSKWCYRGRYNTVVNIAPSLYSETSTSVIYSKITVGDEP